MSGYILCHMKRASLPFYIENISTNIYSMEELCYYLYHNVYLLDETIINEHLCDWIREELGLGKLYQKLYRILEEERSYGDFILAIFREIHYLTHEEFKKVNEQLVLLERQPPAVRKKKKGDYLVENKMYVNAIRIYEDALGSVEEDKMGSQFMGGIYNNMGCAYLYLYQMQEAAQCFRNAYDKLHTRQLLKHYLCTCRMFMSSEEWDSTCVAVGVDASTKNEIIREMEEQKPLFAEEKEKDMEELLEEYTKEYHRSTGF